MQLATCNVRHVGEAGIEVGMDVLYTPLVCGRLIEVDCLPQFQPKLFSAITGGLMYVRPVLLVPLL